MKKGITIIIGVALVAGSIYLAKYLIANKKKPKPRVEKVVKTVFTEKVANQTLPLVITSNGNLVAKNKVALFSEVQGVFELPKKDFKPGIAFNKGEVILKINSDEFYANLQAQKSKLFNTITSVMPDIRMDYPSEYDKWQNYLKTFDMNNTVQELPKTNSDKEQFFISGRGILTAFYNLKNLEVKLSKHHIRAPFNGILTEAMVNPGTLVRPGQNLGEFIDPSVYEMAVDIKSEFKGLLRVGESVILEDLSKTKSWEGQIVRINSKVNANSQTIEAFIQVSGKDLSEGQYLDVQIQGKQEDNAYEVSRNLLVDNFNLYVVKDTILDLIPIHVLFENKNSVIVRGLEDGVQLLSKPVPGAYSGMAVTIFEQNDSKQ